MLRLLRLPPLLTVVIILTVVAYVVYRIVATGTAQPLSIILLALLAFALVRILFSMLRKAQGSESDE